MYDELTQPCEKYISWNAILVGTLFALGITFLFHLLTIATSLTLFTKNPSGQMMLTLAGFVWLLVGGYAILFLSGWVAGRTISHSYSLNNANGFLHGFLIWTIYLIISVFSVSQIATDSAALLVRSNAINTQIQHKMPAFSSTHNNNEIHTAKENTQEEKVVNKIGLQAFATFFIFSVGAMGCCIGTGSGIRACKRCHEKCIITRTASADL